MHTTYPVWAATASIFCADPLGKKLAEKYCRALDIGYKMVQGESIMGLDQYAFAVKDDESIEIMYWRKHANLEGWMSELYASRGGKEEFNCVELKLFESDLDRLQSEHKNLATSAGFFWGTSSESKVAQTTEFIQKALDYQSKGYEIIYTSWW